MIAVRYLLVTASVLCFTINGCGPKYPASEVKMIIPFSEGSATDFIGRTVATKLSEIWGQPVVAENHPGAGGTLGAKVVAKAPADGYTLLLYSSAFTVSPSLHKDLPYNPREDFVGIARGAAFLLGAALPDDVMQTGSVDFNMGMTAVAGASERGKLVGRGVDPFRQAADLALQLNHLFFGAGHEDPPGQACRGACPETCPCG